MESLESWFEDLRQVNADLLAAAKKAKAENFLRRSAVEKYAEPTHFIFELLQNADDQEAKKVHFKLFPDRAEFLHWGKPFKREDVERITRLGDSDKSNEVHKIGSFGIGFKSVFAVTERPEVKTRTLRCLPAKKGSGQSLLGSATAASTGFFRISASRS